MAHTPDELHRCGKFLQPAGKVLYGTLCSRRHHKTGLVRAGRELLAAESGLNETYVSDVLTYLEEKGCIQRIGRQILLVYGFEGDVRYGIEALGWKKVNGEWTHPTLTKKRRSGAKSDNEISDKPRNERASKLGYSEIQLSDGGAKSRNGPPESRNIRGEISEPPTGMNIEFMNHCSEPDRPTDEPTRCAPSGESGGRAVGVAAGEEDPPRSRHPYPVLLRYAWANVGRGIKLPGKWAQENLKTGKYDVEVEAWLQALLETAPAHGDGLPPPPSQRAPKPVPQPDCPHCGGTGWHEPQRGKGVLRCVCFGGRPIQRPPETPPPPPQIAAETSDPAEVAALVASMPGLSNVLTFEKGGA